MSSVNMPFGLRVVNHPDGFLSYTEVDIDVAATAAIKNGQPVSFVPASGVIAPSTPGPGNRVAGVFAGCTYFDAEGSPQNSKHWPGTGIGAQSAKGYIYDQPDLLLEVQASGPVARQMIGSHAQLANAGLANTLNTVSLGVLDVATVSPTVANQFQIVGIRKDHDNNWGDAFTKVLVRISQHQFRADTLAF